MKKILSTVSLILVLSGLTLSAQTDPSWYPVPEIDPGSAVSALALLSGAVLVIRGRRKAKPSVSR